MKASINEAIGAVLNKVKITPAVLAFKMAVIAAAVILAAPLFVLASSAPVFLKNPKAMPMFSEVKIVDAETDQPVGYTLVCDRSIYPSPSGELLTFRVDPHTHYNCQLTAKNSLGSSVSTSISFDTQEWLEINATLATTTLGSSIRFGTLTFTNNSSRTITLIGLPVRLSWALSGVSANKGAYISVTAKNSAGFAYGRNAVAFDEYQKAVSFTLGLGSIALASGQSTQIFLDLEDLRVPLAGGEWVMIENASSTLPAEIVPSGIEIIGSFRLLRTISGGSIVSPPSQSNAPTSSGAPAALFNRDMEFGSRGDDVRQLQKLLATDSSIYPEGLVTGYYGQKTVAAVRRFQARYGLPQVGRVGPKTRAKLNEILPTGTIAPQLPLAPSASEKLPSATPTTYVQTQPFILRPSYILTPPPGNIR